MYDFELIHEQTLSELGGTAKLWKHIPTGAELLSVVNDDENKCFGVTFRTPPENSTGVPHILEHSVLCGSEKYPTKEPFVELLKGSLQTFLNAFTFPDKTCYPVASVNKQDFANLVNVYLDAVFFPRITEECFQQEGWHIETDNADPLNGPLSYKGVVYNEMKGVYSSPDSLLAEQSQQAVFPDNTYSLDSGGDPEVILSLTYEAFKQFHTEHYHPSNARFFFWGDLEEEQRFALLMPYLQRFSQRAPGAAVPLQKHLDTPRHIEVPYAAEVGETRGHITLNWLLCETADIEAMFCFEMLEHILLALPGSPLRKALIESGLGEDVTGCGLEGDLRQAYFSVGLRSIDPSKAHEVEVLIMDTLAGFAEEGLPKDAVDAALNSLEFQLRENNTGSFPRGLSAMVACLATWLHDGDPFGPLAWEKPLATLKQRLQANEPIFENAIRTHFLNNTHRATVLLLPDAMLAERTAKKERDRLDRIQNALNESERQALAAFSQSLQEAQQRPDSPEALASIPSLTLDDLPKENTVIPTDIKHVDNNEVLVHELNTTGIVYATVLLPLEAVPTELIPLTPLFGRALTEMGTQRQSFVELGTSIASKTGGLGAGPSFLSHISTGKPIAHLVMTGKATADHTADLFDLMREVLLETRFDNSERFCQMVLEECARMEQALVPAGHKVISTRMRARHSLSGWLGELISGVSYLDYLRQLSKRVTEDWLGVQHDLERLRDLIIRSPGSLCNLTADGSALAVAEDCAAQLFRALPKHNVAVAEWLTSDLPQAEALLAPAQVNYVGTTCNLYQAGYTYNASIAVLTRHIRMGWLWDQVRVQGGAYGAFCSFDRVTGAFAQASYRDPNVEKTLKVYADTANYLQNLTLSQRELTLSIVGAIGDFDSYQLPDAKGWTALIRHLCGDNDEQRQQRRDQVFATTLKDFHQFGESLQTAMESNALCVLGGAQAEAAALANQWTITKLF